MNSSLGRSCQMISVFSKIFKEKLFIQTKDTFPTNHMLMSILKKDNSKQEYQPYHDLENRGFCGGISSNLPGSRQR